MRSTHFSHTKDLGEIPNGLASTEAPSKLCYASEMGTYV